MHRKSDDTAGLTTAWMQQREALRQKNILVNPRDEVINNIMTHIRQDIDSNKSVIILGDFNERLDSKEGTHDKLTKAGLINLMEKRVPGPLPKTWNRGRSAIDHIYI